MNARTNDTYIHPAMRRKLMLQLRLLYNVADSLGGLPVANSLRRTLCDIREILHDGLTADDIELIDENARLILGDLLDDLDLGGEL